MACLPRPVRATSSTPVAVLVACLLAGCSSSAPGTDSPSGLGGSDTLPADDASSSDAPPGDAAVMGTTGDAADTGAPQDAAADVFASCPASRPASGSFPAAVAQVLSAKCQTCHESPPRNHAPFPLLAYADTQAADPLPPYTGVPIWQVMHAVIQPDGTPHMPFGNAPQLTSSEFATLDGWLLACALPQ